MILSLDTSTPVAKIGLYKDGEWVSYEWEAGRTLAKELLGVLDEFLQKQGTQLADVTGIIGFRGPGSFTGLRIGLTVLNTLAYSQAVPIVGATGDQWQSEGLTRLDAGENDELVMPEYGGDPHITTPRK